MAISRTAGQLVHDQLQRLADLRDALRLVDRHQLVAGHVIAQPGQVLRAEHLADPDVVPRIEPPLEGGGAQVILEQGGLADLPGPVQDQDLPLPQVPAQIGVETRDFHEYRISYSLK